MIFKKSISKKASPAKPGQSGGFTLLEILLVVGIISILAGIVIIAINPSKQLASVRNTERKTDLKTLYNAMNQFYIDRGYYPASSTLSTTLTEVCDTGAVASTSVATDGTSCSSFINLSYDLVPTYIVAIPKDPQGPVLSFLNQIIPTVYAAAGGTGYKIATDANRKIILTTARRELEVEISIGTSTAVSSSVPATTYTVTYNGNTNTGGTVPANQTKTQDVTLTLATNSGTLVKSGYTFAGWNTAANGSGTDYAVGASYTANAAATLYAKWTASSTLGDGLIAHYLMNDTGGTTVVDTKGQNGTSVRDTSLMTAAGATGNTGTSLNFNGSDYVLSPYLDSLSGIDSTFSVSFWLNASCADTSWCGAPLFVSPPTNWQFVLGSYINQGSFWSGVGDNGTGYSTVISPANKSVGVWYHVVIIYTNRTLTTYLDGSLVGSVANSYTGVNAATNRLAIGAQDTVNGFTGKIDDVRLYSRVLTGSEITELAAGTEAE